MAKIHNSKKKKLSRLLSTATGQTILEVLIALILMILFLSGVVVVELYAVRNVEFARRKSTATTLARQQLERARVIRDSQGIGALAVCQAASGCYISQDLQVEIITPTGTYGQILYMQGADEDDCPLPAGITITPEPTSFLATSHVNWAVGVTITPEPEVIMSSCITDWR